MQKQITMTKTITIKNGTTINYELKKCSPSKNGIALSWRVVRMGAKPKL